jgi:hypothetical protein
MSHFEVLNIKYNINNQKGRFKMNKGLNKYVIKAVMNDGTLKYDEIYAEDYDKADDYWCEFSIEYEDEIQGCKLLSPKEDLELLSERHDFDIVRYSDITLHATIKCEDELLETYFDERYNKWF